MFRTAHCLGIILVYYVKKVPFELLFLFVQIIVFQNEFSYLDKHQLFSFSAAIK